jgi:hypothetical protein
MLRKLPKALRYTIIGIIAVLAMLAVIFIVDFIYEVGKGNYEIPDQS